MLIRLPLLARALPTPPLLATAPPAPRVVASRKAAPKARCLMALARRAALARTDRKGRLVARRGPLLREYRWVAPKAPQLLSQPQQAPRAALTAAAPPSRYSSLYNQCSPYSQAGPSRRRPKTTRTRK